jgi:microcompartment protein CcmK/EutM
MNTQMAEVPPGSYLLVRTLNRGSLAGKNEGNEEELIMFDNLGAREGDLVGLVEGREAANPFHPKKVPFDAYCACILTDIFFRPILDVT